MFASSSAAGAPLRGPAIVQALRPQMLDYRVRSLVPVLRRKAEFTPPTLPGIRILDPSGTAPVLLVGNAAVPAGQWSFGDGALEWKSDGGIGSGPSSGLILFREEGAVGSGLLTLQGTAYNVQVEVRPVVYHCLLSANAGAHMSSGAEPALHLHTDGVNWDTATWVDAGLQFGYAVTSDVGIGNVAEILPVFTDTSTGDIWQPDSSTTSMTGDGVLSFDASGEVPDADDRSNVPPAQQAFQKIFPTLLLAQFSPDAQTFAAAMLVDNTVVPPLVVAVRGTFIATPGGEDRPEPFGRDAARAAGVLEVAEVAGAAAAPDALDGKVLVNLSPFQIVGTQKGVPQWADVVQKPTVSDFYDILRSYLSDDLLAYVAPVDPSTNKPIRPQLNPAVQAIAEMVGADGSTPAAWYNTMAVPYLAQAMSNMSGDPFAAKLNAVRAQNWMTRRLAAAPVYNAQMPALYAHHFKTIVPEVVPFLLDQVAQNATYAPQIAADAASWQAQIIGSLSNPTADTVKTFTDMVAELSAAGSNNCFWAYWLFRYMTNPIQLARLQNASMRPGQNNTEFARQVQAGCATLSVLDASGTFTRHYAQVISLVQIANILPQLLNYAGSADAFNYIVPRLLQAFIDRYGKSTDPDIQAAIKELEQAIADGVTSDLLNGFLAIAGEITAVYDWQTLVSSFEKTWPKTAKGMLFAANLLTVACAAGGLAMFIIGTKGWDGLNDQGKASVVAGGIELFSNMALSLIKRGTAAGLIFGDKGLNWETLKIVLNPFEDNVIAAQKMVLAGLLKRIVGGSAVGPDGYVELIDLAEARGAAANEAWTTTERIFGRNLDEFAIRLGAIFAIINLVLSAISLANATDPLDIASNALFVAAAAIEIIAFAGGWIAGLLAVDVIAGIAVATLISVCTYVAAALAIIGLIVMLVLIFEHHPTPIETFATGKAKDAGFYMPLGYAIESLQPYSIPGQPSNVGVSLSASGGAAAVLRIDANGALSIGPLDASTATGFYLVTDGDGRVRFSSVTTAPSSPVLCLALPAGKGLAATAYVDDDKDDSQWWLAELLEVPQTITRTGGPDGPVTRVTSGRFNISAASAPQQFLDLSGPIPQLSSQATPITITMVPVAPQGLTMRDISLTTVQRDLSFVPILVALGSSPRSWSIAPALPPFLAFDNTSGLISQLEGIAPTALPATPFTLSCSNAAGPPASASFKLSVQVAATTAALAVA